MYILIIDGCYSDRKEATYTFSTITTARAYIWKYIRKGDSGDQYDTVDARLYETRKSNNGKCKLVDEFSDVALGDGYAKGWKSEGRREAESEQWEAEREAERQWRAEYVAIPIERHAD